MPDSEPSAAEPHHPPVEAPAEGHGPEGEEPAAPVPVGSPWSSGPDATFGGPELDLDPAAFLPEGSELAAPDDAPAGPPGVDVDPGPGAAHEDHVVEELVYEEPDGEVGLDPAVEEPLGEPATAVAGGVAGAGPGPGEDAGSEPVDLTALTRIEADLDAVDRALAALDDGTYGTCAVCGRPVGEALLASDPVRRSCADHDTPVGSPGPA